MVHSSHHGTRRQITGGEPYVDGGAEYIRPQVRSGAARAADVTVFSGNQRRNPKTNCLNFNLSQDKPCHRLRRPPAPRRQDFVPAGVLRLLDVIGKLFRRGDVERSRSALLERLVRSLLVVLAPEGVESALLRLHVSRWRAYSFLLQRQMESLVATILLGLAWLDALEGDAGLDDFHRQL